MCKEIIQIKTGEFAGRTVQAEKVLAQDGVRYRFDINGRTFGLPPKSITVVPSGGPMFENIPINLEEELKANEKFRDLAMGTWPENPAKPVPNWEPLLTVPDPNERMVLRFKNIPGAAETKLLEKLLSTKKRGRKPMKRWYTQVHAKDPITDELKIFVGPVIKAATQEKAQQYCNEHGMSYVRVTSTVLDAN